MNEEIFDHLIKNDIELLHSLYFKDSNDDSWEEQIADTGFLYDTMPKDEWLSIAQKAPGSVVEVEGVKVVQIGEWRFLAEAKEDNNQSLIN